MVGSEVIELEISQNLIRIKEPKVEMLYPIAKNKSSIGDDIEKSFRA